MDPCKSTDNSKEIIRVYNDNLPRRPFNPDIVETQHVKCNLHWGQRKLLMSEIDFLNRYYDDYDQSKDKYLLYVGASPGHHINYLKKMFPDIHFILYDKVKTAVELDDHAEFHHKYFDQQEAEKYKDKNLFFVCDIRNLDVGKLKGDERTGIRHGIIGDDMSKQMEWVKIMNPKQSLLKFKLTWLSEKTEYLDGTVYFQVWNTMGSNEQRLVPDKSYKTKIWNNITYEEICAYFNHETRFKKIKHNFGNCLGQYHESVVEGLILKEYVEKFEPDITDINTRICEISLSITMYLMKYTKNVIPADFLKPVSEKLIEEMK